MEDICNNEIKMPGIGLGIRIGGNKSNVNYWNNYWKNNCLQYFDGTIDGGELIDKSSFGLNAIITLNAVRNGDCEGDWGWTKYGGVTQTIERSTTQVYGGIYSWKFTGDGINANLGMNHSPFYIRAGQTYNYNFWAYKETINTSDRVYMRIYDGDGITLLVPFTTILKSVYGSWINITGNFTATKTGNGAYINLYSAVATMVFYIDDIKIENQNASDFYIRLQSNASLITADIDNKFFDISGNPYTLNLLDTEPYYSSNLFYNLSLKKILFYSSDVFGNNFVESHDYIEWNPITHLTNIKTVKKDGTGDYLTIQAALTGIIDASSQKKYRIDIYDDWVATDTDDYTAEGAYYHYLVLKNYIYFNGIGSSKRIISCSLPLRDDAYCVFNVTVITGFNNIQFESENVRYTIHADSPPLMYVYNCDFTSNGSETTIGEGTESGGRIWYYNCNIIGAKPYQTHDNITFTKGSLSGFIKCNFVAPSVTDDALLIQAIGEDGRINKVILNKCFITGRINYVGYVYYSGVASGLNYILSSIDILGTDNNYSTYINSYPTIGQQTTNGSLKIASTNPLGSLINVAGNSTLMPTPDYLSNYAIGQLEVGEWNGNNNLKMGVRLGDCSGTNKTLSMDVDGVGKTVTFNENFTAKTNAYILSFINTALAGSATASLYQRASDYTPVGL